jgi:uncharacterized membrane protein (UPF0127 family)
VKKYVALSNLSQPQTRPVIAHYCQSFLCQLRGLMFTRRIDPEQGLLLVQKRDSRLDSAIHMLFVPIDLAVIWINQEKIVVDACLARRWRPVYVPQKAACYVLETHPQRLLDFNLGDRVSLDETTLD